jgi:hypothetical protein
LKTFLLILVLALLVPIAVFCQKDAPKHTCRILFFNAPADAPQKLFLFDGTESLEVELPKMNFSPVYELASGKIVITLLPGAINDPKKIPADAPKVVVPKGVVDFYLLVTSDKDNKVAPVRMQVINAGADKLKLGQMLWFNLTDLTVGGMVGTEKLLIGPKKRLVLDAPAKGHVNFPVSLSFRITGDKQLYPLCETKWRHDSGRSVRMTSECRSIVGFSSNPWSNPFAIHSPDRSGGPCHFSDRI